MSTALAAAIVAGFTGFALAVVLCGLMAAASKPDVCHTCDNGRVVVYAGDLDRDDGYCELRWCPTCCDGTRLGRSDVPIVSRGIGPGIPEVDQAYPPAYGIGADEPRMLHRIDGGPRAEEGAA